MFRTLASMMFTRDERLLGMAEKYLTLGDMLGIWKRMIGTGLIGGKSVGMLLARAMLRTTHPRWNELLEAHDSFFIGSDVFYSFLVENGCWWLRQKQHDRQGFLDDIEEARRRIITGNLSRQHPQGLCRDAGLLRPVADHRQVQQPVGGQLRQRLRRQIRKRVLRQSGLAPETAGGFRRGRQDDLCQHDERKSTALPAQRGLLERDEQMPLLVQRVSGSLHGNLFFPQIAGVGLSVNPYVWNKSIDPTAGMVRLVFGLGTRAVDRADDDYTRVVALERASPAPRNGHRRSPPVLATSRGRD